MENLLSLNDYQIVILSASNPCDRAVIGAGTVRFRPMLLTAMAVVVGAGVILFDPIFQGLAISLMAGEIASLLLSRMAVPVLFYLTNRNEVVAEPKLTGTWMAHLLISSQELLQNLLIATARRPQRINPPE